PLIANFTFSPPNPDTGVTISFSGSATGGTQPYVYNWSFGDGDRGTGQTIRHVYPTAGNYTTSLTVIGESGQLATTSKSISIDKDPNLAGTCQGCTSTTTPRTLGLIISMITGVALPLTGSMIVSRRHRRTAGDTET